MIFHIGVLLPVGSSLGGGINLEIKPNKEIIININPMIFPITNTRSQSCLFVTLLQVMLEAANMIIKPEINKVIKKE